jgi:hypothetical protein
MDARSSRWSKWAAGRYGAWRLDMPSDHLPILFFNGIGANIEAVAPLAEALPDAASSCSTCRAPANRPIRWCPTIPSP